MRSRKAGIGLRDAGLVAATSRPGLIGALLVGLSTAKALAAAARLPFTAVDHLHGHVAANFLEPDPLEPPFLCLIASGGHTLLASVERRDGYTLLGSTRDDAAGEALDKAARMMGLGYPGGAEIDRLAREGDPEAFDFPVGMRRGDSLDFSFSGLKTALVYKVRELGADGTLARRAGPRGVLRDGGRRSLLLKVEQALDSTGARRLAIGGGVAANSLLRREVAELCERKGLELKIPPPALCTDNAAMIASAARFLEPVPYPGFLGVRRLRAQRRLTRRDRLHGRPNRFMPTLTLYTKPDCTLCDDARDALERVRARTPFELEVVDISADASWRSATASESRSCWWTARKPSSTWSTSVRWRAGSVPRAGAAR